MKRKKVDARERERERKITARDAPRLAIYMEKKMELETCYVEKLILYSSKR